MAHFGSWNSYRSLPQSLIRYLLVISIAGPAVAIGWLILAPGAQRPEGWLNVVVLVILAGLAERFSVQLTHKTYINVASAVYVAMLLSLPLPWCGVAGLIAVSAAQAHRLWSTQTFGLAEPLFNIGQTAVYMTGASIAVMALAAVTSERGEIGDISIAMVLVASLTLHLLNSALVAGASARHLTRGTMRVWRQNVLLDIGPHAGMTLVGVCAAQLGHASPLLIPALAMPAILVHRAVRGARELRENTRDALASLVEIVELRDPYTAGHSRRVAGMARQIAIELGLTVEEADAIEDAGNVHDLGKVAIDPAILLKPGKLTDGEWSEMKLHPVYGAEVLSRFESYRAGIPLVRGHHESWDGTGYPDKLEGSGIPLGARILAVADTFDALTSDRPYRSGMDRRLAMAILQDGAGTQWDPAVVAAFSSLLARNEKSVEQSSSADPRESSAEIVTAAPGLSAA